MQTSPGHARADQGGAIATSRLHVIGMISLVFIVAMVVFHQRREAQLAEQAASEPATAEEPADWLPLAEGNRWRYKATITDRRTGAVTKQSIEEIVSRREGDGFRIVQEVDGKQQDSRFYTPTAEGLRVLEYESQREPVLFLPAADLEPGISWDISPSRRARVESVEPVAAGTETVDAARIRLERFYSKDDTDEPGWLPDGHFWVARGIGVVKRDSSSSKRPVVREGQGRMTAGGPQLEIETVLQLESYQVRGGHTEETKTGDRKDG